ncbi:hypothetical protein GCM10009122_50560 [Fulvivirga kasyanovii]|uniref:DUF4827 family protein n=2 Tax=Fulvivirga kasyanovii TaxID=396812 RepID=A0ABW9RP66_9BACT|nr:hypothetical protein [Fulvivirga kasyanovii]
MLLFAVACKPEYLSEEELKSYVLDEDNNLSKSSSYKGFDIQVTYRPNDLIILQETGGETAVDTAELKRLESKYSDYYYFILSISRDDKEALYQSGGGQGQFSELVQVLSFRMGQYVNLTTSERDTIPVGDYVYPRTYGMGGATTLMFAFSREKVKADEWLQFNLKEFGMGLGSQTFRFRREDLENVPQIKFTEIIK